MKRILVTGASRGLGRALTAELVGRGYGVVATARRLADLDDVAAASKLQLDVTDAESVAAAAAAAGPVDILVNNAINGSGGGPVETVPVDTVREVFETNLFGALRLTQALLPGMRERGSGLVANISSVAGRIAPPLAGVYAASKAALEMLGDALNFEVRHFGVRVVSLQLGGVKTGHVTAHPLHTSPAYQPLTDQVAARLAQWANSDWGMSPQEAASRVVDVLELPDPPTRVPVGADAERFLAMADAGQARSGQWAGAAANRRAGMGLDW
jgi:NAD(P)-dependent dehydrogenase (short-subunit alcohol dehydrogenase family)